MQVEGQHGTSVLMATGARVSNAYAIYLQEWNSPGKLGLIPHSIIIPPGIVIKASVLGDERASY
jgi:hypothetical protein